MKIEVCEMCGDFSDTLTPISIPYRPGMKWYFHNEAMPPKNCLRKWIEREKRKHEISQHFLPTSN
jgi:hypothetical protein